MLARRLGVAVAAIGVLASLPACGGAASHSGSSGDAQSEKATIVASFYPWAWLSSRVAGDASTIETLTAPGAEPHDMELTARQVVEIGQADLVVYVSGMQPAVDDAVAQHASDRALDAATVVKTLPIDGSTAIDPHIWLDPLRFAKVAEKLGGRLAAADPAHASGYRERAADVVRRLRELDKAYREGLSRCESRTLTTGHASFGYLADRYDLEQVPIAGLSPEVPPSPARLAELTRFVESRDIEVIFLERSEANEAATTLAEETGARTVALDAVSIRSPDAPAGYLSAMRENLSTLRKALGCT